MKRINIRTVGASEGEEQGGGGKSLFKERIAEDIPNLGKDLNTHDHEPTRFNITSIQNNLLQDTL